MLKKLKGSEKQIAWAEKIREDRMNDFYYWQKLFLEKAQKNYVKYQFITKQRKKRKST
jgi:hypothetical protein